MYHVDFQREIFSIDVVLGRSVYVELSESEIGAGKGSGSVHDDFNGGTQILKLNLLLRNVQRGLLGCKGDYIVN